MLKRNLASRLLGVTAVLLSVIAVPASQAQQPVAFLTTFAGDGAEGYSGDGGQAARASLYAPSSVAVDAFNNVYVADSLNHRVRRISVAGVITTVAGNGAEGFSGDGGKAPDAQLSQPQGVTLDGSGNLYIVDYGNQRIRKVAPDGTMITIAGGKKGFSGDNGSALNAAFHDPLSLAIDPLGNLYVADTENSRIRKVGFDGVITTVAGTVTAGFSGDGGLAINAELNRPTDVVVDGAGNLLIADSENHRIRRVAPNGTITTVAGSGDPAVFDGGFAGDGRLATEAMLSTPTDVAVDEAGNLYFTDTFNSRVRKVDPNGIISTIAGSGIEGYSGDRSVATEAALYEPIGVEVDGDGNLFIVDSENQRIRKVFDVASPGMLGGRPFPPPAPGDPNRDGRVNVQDAILVLRAIAKLVSLSPPQRIAADYNGDGRVDVRDAVAILRRAAGIKP